MKILIVKLSAIGDVIHSLPIAMAIKRQKPSWQVDWVVEPPSAGILEGHPALTRVIVSPRKAVWDSWGTLLGGMRSFWRDLRQVSYDFIIDLQGLYKSALVTATAQGERKIGFAGGKEAAYALALNEKLPPYDIERHAIERYLDLLDPLGLERPARPEYGLHISPGDEARALDLIPREFAGQSFFILHPVAKWESKLWPRGHWIDLAGRLKKDGVLTVLSGSGDDKEVCKSIAQGGGSGILDLSGRTSLKQLAALIKMARGLVSTDTGIMHLGAALGAPVTAVFGPTAPWRTGPYGKGHQCLRLGLDCSPCFRRECPLERRACLLDLGVGRVHRALEPLLKGN